MSLEQLAQCMLSVTLAYEACGLTREAWVISAGISQDVQGHIRDDRPY